MPKIRSSFVDEDLLMFVEMIKDQLKTVKHIVGTLGTRKEAGIGHRELIMYDELIAQFPEEYDFLWISPSGTLP